MCILIHFFFSICTICFWSECGEIFLVLGTQSQISDLEKKSSLIADKISGIFEDICVCRQRLLVTNQNLKTLSPLVFKLFQRVKRVELNTSRQNVHVYRAREDQVIITVAGLVFSLVLGFLTGLLGGAAAAIGTGLTSRMVIVNRKISYMKRKAQNERQLIVLKRQLELVSDFVQKLQLALVGLDIELVVMDMKRQLLKREEWEVSSQLALLRPSS